MPSMNILADFESATQSISRLNKSILDFKNHILRIKDLYDEDDPSAYLLEIDTLWQSLSHREMYLLIGLLGNEQTICEIAEETPNILLEKLFF